MKQLKLSIKNKIKSSKGMTLVEILVAVIIMLLATAVLVTVVNLGVNQYTKTVSNSESNTLFSTLESVMTNELAYTSEVHVEDKTTESNVTEFQSQNFAVSDSLSTFIISGADSGGYGQVKIGNSENNLSLLGKGAYPKGLGVKIEKFTYDPDNYMFTIELKIGCKSTEYLDKTFQIINVNKTTLKVVED